MVYNIRISLIFFVIATPLLPFVDALNDPKIKIFSQWSIKRKRKSISLKFFCSIWFDYPVCYFKLKRGYTIFKKKFCSDN